MQTTNLTQALETESHKTCLALARKEGKENTGVSFDRSSDMSEVLYYLQFERGTFERNQAYPELRPATIEKSIQETSHYLFAEIRSAAREVETYAATQAGNDRLDELKDAFTEGMLANKKGNQEEIFNILGYLGQKLTLFATMIPGFEGNTYVEEVQYACDPKSKAWKKYVRKIQNMSRETPEETNKTLEVIRENATYGGIPGILFQIDGHELAKWIKTRNLTKIIRERNNDENHLCDVGVLNFNNGSGHIESMKIDWSKFTINWQSPAGIVNNYIDDIFGRCGNSKLSLPKHLDTGSHQVIWLCPPF